MKLIRLHYNLFTSMEILFIFYSGRYEEYIYACMHTNTHTHIHTHTHTHTHGGITFTRLYTHLHGYTVVRNYTRTPAHILTHTYIIYI